MFAVSNPGQNGESAEPSSSHEDNVSLTELNAKLEAYKKGLENAWEAIDGLKEQLGEERAERRRLQAENEDLRAEIERLDARTDLLRLVEQSDDMTGKQRSVALIQHLRRAAERQRDRGRPAKSSVDRDDAESALQFPDVDRTTIYDDMRRAVRLVDNEAILWYESNSGGESRLKLDLEAGDLPSEIVGQPTNHGGG